jgi:hypothetical protein
MSPCSVLGSRHPTGTLALDSARGRPSGEGCRSRDAGHAAALGEGRPSCEPATAKAAPSPRRQTRRRQATTPPADHGARRPTAPNRGTRHTEPLQLQRGAGRGGSAAEPDTWPSGHWTLDGWTPGHVDAGCVDARPLDRLDGRPHGRTGRADRATTGLVGVRTFS